MSSYSIFNKLITIAILTNRYLFSLQVTTESNKGNEAGKGTKPWMKKNNAGSSQNQTAEAPTGKTTFSPLFALTFDLALLLSCPEYRASKKVSKWVLLITREWLKSDG